MWRFPRLTDANGNRVRGVNRLWLSQILWLTNGRWIEVRTVAVLSLVVVGALIAFFAVLEDVVTGDPLVRIDDALFHGLQSLRTPMLDRAMVGVTELGDWVVTSAVTVVAVLWLVWHRNLRTALYLCAAVLASSVFSFLLKISLRVSRPINLFSGWDAFSFPSGHATVNASLYGFLAALIAREVTSWKRWGVVTSALIFILSITFSRLYLGAHFLSDVLAGLSFSTAWVALLSAIQIHFKRDAVEIGGLARVILLTVIFTGGWHIHYRLAADIEKYASHTQRIYGASAYPISVVIRTSCDFVIIPLRELTFALAHRTFYASEDEGFAILRKFANHDQDPSRESAVSQAY